MKNLKLALLLVLFPLCNSGIAQVTPDFVERIDFSIPKTIYFTGEKIWLSIHVEADSQPTPSRIVYAELWNRYGESSALAKLPLAEGTAFNYLQIPDDLPSDQYLLRVFTRVSASQNSELGLIQQLVTVFNPRIPPEVVVERKKNPDQELTPTSLFLSAKSLEPGEEIQISYSGADQILELSVAVLNPFLPKDGKIPSSELYERIPDRYLVPEFFGHLIEAHVQRGDSAASGLYYLSLHGEKSALFTDKVDKNGSLFFDAGGLRHWDFAIAQGRENQAMSNFEIVSPSPRTRFKSGYSFPKLQISPEDAPLLEALLRGSQIEGYFVQEFQNEPIPVVTGFVEDRTFVLDDYNRFENVETHIKEYVPEVAVRTRDKYKELRMLNAPKNMSFTENPLLLVDAMPVADSDMLLRFNPAKFQKLEILTRSFFLNEEIYSGVISFSSYGNDFGGFPLPTNAMYIPYPGVMPPVTETNALFSATQQSETIDWRTILFWSRAWEGSFSEKSVTVVAPLLKGVFQVVLKTRDSNWSIKYEYVTFKVD